MKAGSRRTRSLTVAEMRETDRRCIEEIGIPGAVLMYNAGKAVFAEVDRGPVGIVCGMGNNGGDGFVVALLALLAGYEVRAVLLGEEETLAGDPAIFHGAYKRLGGEVHCARGADAVRAALEGLRDSAVVVDALLGTGTRGDVRGDARVAIEHWPDCPVLAVDVPSGLDAGTGEPCGVAVRAEVTVTFQFPKRGFENPAARAYLGRLVVADIGIPGRCVPAPGELD